MMKNLPVVTAKDEDRGVNALNPEGRDGLSISFFWTPKFQGSKAPQSPLTKI